MSGIAQISDRTARDLVNRARVRGVVSRGPIHPRREVPDVLIDHPRVDTHYFPAYAPELHPAEYVWAQADHELANGAPDNLCELRQRLTDATRRLRRSKDLRWSCIHASDVPWAR